MTTFVAPTPSTSSSTIPRIRLSAGWWPERVASLLAVTGVLISIFLNFHVHTWQQSGSDFKTMYGSAVSMAHGQSAYVFQNIAAVFRHNSVAEPASWFGHSPVYPPFTIALLTPLAALPMDVAVYVWVVLSGIVFALALASLARFAGECFAFSRPWRLLLIALAAASPMLSFALEMGNVSVIVSALCLLAVVLPERKVLPEGEVLPGRANDWPRAVALALALLLKPHLALWIVLAMLFLNSRRCREVAVRALAATAFTAGLLAALLAIQGTLALQVGGYLLALRSELGGGSMDAARHDLLGVSAQITSLESFTGYWSTNLHPLDAVLLIAAFVVLVAASLRLRTAGPALQLALIGAWSSFGLLATYHRAHDGIILLALLPWMFAILRQRWYAAFPWVVFALVITMSWGPTWEFWQAIAPKPVLGPVAGLMLYRQAPLATLLLAAVLLHQLLRAAFAPLTPSSRAEPLRPLPV